MKCHLICCGSKMPAWVNEGFQDFQKRLPREWALQLHEAPIAKRHNNTPVPKLMQQEADSIRKRIPKQSLVVALDSRGKQFSSLDLAQKLQVWHDSGETLCLLIGGPDGLDPSLQSTIKESWSLGKMTLAHPLARLVVAEQWYRAWSILAGHPYHR